MPLAPEELDSLTAYMDCYDKLPASTRKLMQDSKNDMDTINIYMLFIRFGEKAANNFVKSRS